MTATAAVRSIVLVALALLLGSPAARANEPPLDYILIPVVASHARDSAGAVWSSAVSFLYTGDVQADVFNEPFVASREVQPGERGMLDIRAEQAKAGPGVIIATTAFPSKTLYVQSYVYNEAKPGVGVAVPCIRIFNDLTANQTIRLIGIPIDRASRTLVRIYAMANTDPVVIVHVYDSSGHALATDMVQLVSPPLLPQQTNVGQPAYAEYRPAADPAKYSAISIDIEPVSPREPASVFGPAIWAFSTTTSGASDSVTAVFPAK